MSTKTKEEQQLLDEKIARIQKKNEEILRRQKEIEEDKRLAEQQNAIVKLRPSTVNASRERTPALKPSNRELRDFPEQFEEPVIQRSTRGSFRSRGSERYRGQGDWKANGPPPDPKSFLYDDERDGPPRDREVKGDLRRELDRKRSDERDNKEDFRGGRDFQRGGRRDGSEYRSERGRRGSGRGRGRRNDEEAWRAERLRIDEARIQRQKSADGKWRREWDNEKIIQEPEEESRYEPRRPTNQEQWHSPPHQHHHPHHHHHHHHQQCEIHASSDHHHHECHHHSQPVMIRGGRGRGRLDLTELEKPLDNIPIDLLQQKASSRGRFERGGVHIESSNRQNEVVEPLPHNLSPTSLNDFTFSGRRSIECVGNMVKVSIPNTNVGHSPPRGQRKINEPRGRLRSQASYSSQSDEDSPRDKGQRGGRRPRTQKYTKNQDKLPSPPQNKSPNVCENTAEQHLTTQNKPPLPPTKLSQKPLSSAEDKEGDESWEDVTTSGAESTGEELVSTGSNIPNMTITNSAISNESYAITDTSNPDVLEIETSDYYDKYLNEIDTSSSLSDSFNATNVVYATSIEPVQHYVENVLDAKTQEKCALNTRLVDIESVVNLEEVEQILDACNISSTTPVNNDCATTEHMESGESDNLLLKVQPDISIDDKNVNIESTTLDKKELVPVETINLQQVSVTNITVPEVQQLSSESVNASDLKMNSSEADENTMITNEQPSSDESKHK